MRRIVICMTLALLLAGCSGGKPGPAASPSPSPAPSARLGLPMEDMVDNGQVRDKDGAIGTIFEEGKAGAAQLLDDAGNGA